MTSKIDEKSWISVGLSILLVGGAFWATMTYAQTNQNKSDIVELKQANSEYLKTIQALNDRMSRMEGMLMVLSGKAK
jgi:uncharacterized membrane protein YukC